jgi:hypothetical protein
MKFYLKKTHELTEEDFEFSQVWAEYYEPDDIGGLVNLGYDLQEVQSELEKVDYSDEYSFPIPLDPPEPFKYIFFAIKAQLASGKILKGYCTSNITALFHGDDKYYFNPHFKDESLENEKELKKAISCKSTIFPIQVEILPLNKRYTLDLD